MHQACANVARAVGLCVGLCAAAPTGATTIIADTVWRGQISLKDDVLVAAGATLTVAAGTVVTVAKAKSTRSEPEYLSPLIEITVRGRLDVGGTARAPVRFVPAQAADDPGWAGILFDGGGGTLRNCRIGGAEAGVTLMQASVELEGCRLANNRYGLVAAGRHTRARLRAVDIHDNDYGMVRSHGAEVQVHNGRIDANRRAQSVVGPRPPPVSPPNTQASTVSTAQDLPVKRVLGDDVLTGETIWEGRIRIAGRVRVPAGSRLVILPGTVIEFAKHDRNGDGIGDNGLQLQGILIAKGSPQRPILFRSAQPRPSAGDWDAVNIFNSDGTQNLVEHCVFEHAYRALHFHFANVFVQRSEFAHNLRGLQFQESAVVLRDNTILHNRSAIRARDSEVELHGNYVAANYAGVSFLRTNLRAGDNHIVANLREGLRIRGGSSWLQTNTVVGNRWGILIKDSFRASLARNVISGSVESGIALRASDNIVIADNFVGGNTGNGISAHDSGLVITGNHLSGNGQRGLGLVGCGAQLRANTIANNRLCGIGVERSPKAQARGNWWGDGASQQLRCDASDETPAQPFDTSGAVSTAPLFRWPTPRLAGDTAWLGRIAIDSSVEVPADVALVVEAATSILFAPQTGLAVFGRLDARGRPEGPIRFSSQSLRQPGAWGELLIERATDTVLKGCVVEYASWGVHSHFTNLRVEGSTFRHNQGGMRFRGGPVTITASRFEGNGIGMRAYRAVANISDNVIRDNGIGIFVREKGAGLRIFDNDIYANRRAAIRLGDFNREDVDARSNWWGGTDPQPRIYDGRLEPEVGRVVYEPYRNHPVTRRGRSENDG